MTTNVCPELPDVETFCFHTTGWYRWLAEVDVCASIVLRRSRELAAEARRSRRHAMPHRMGRARAHSQRSSR